MKLLFKPAILADCNRPTDDHDVPEGTGKHTLADAQCRQKLSGENQVWPRLSLFALGKEMRSKVLWAWEEWLGLILFFFTPGLAKLWGCARQQGSNNPYASHWSKQGRCGARSPSPPWVRNYRYMVYTFWRNDQRHSKIIVFWGDLIYIFPGNCIADSRRVCKTYGNAHWNAQIGLPGGLPAHSWRQ